ncbi:MAG: hypothetical protein R3B45_04900 [Bdellovibrionota bacterium]
MKAKITVIFTILMALSACGSSQETSAIHNPDKSQIKESEVSVQNEKPLKEFSNTDILGSLQVSKTVLLVGNIQYEEDCIRADHKDGCLRVVVQKGDESGNIKYIDRSFRNNSGAEFNLIRDGEFLKFRLWYNSTDSIELNDNALVAIVAKLDGPTVTRIYKIENIK